MQKKRTKKTNTSFIVAASSLTQKPRLTNNWAHLKAQDHMKQTERAAKQRIISLSSSPVWNKQQILRHKDVISMILEISMQSHLSRIITSTSKKYKQIASNILMTLMLNSTTFSVPQRFEAPFTANSDMQRMIRMKQSSHGKATFRTISLRYRSREKLHMILTKSVLNKDSCFASERATISSRKSTGSLPSGFSQTQPIYSILVATKRFCIALSLSSKCFFLFNAKLAYF